MQSLTTNGVKQYILIKGETMKKLFALLMLVPGSICAMQDSDEKGYCEAVLGSLVLVKETPTPNGSQIEGTFRKGDKVSCTVDSEGNATATIITKKGEEFAPESFLGSSQELRELLQKKAEKTAVKSPRQDS